MARRGEMEAYHYMAETMRTLEMHLHGTIAESGRIPPEWHEIGRERGTMPKVRVNLYVEADVLRFFKGMGQGWSTRMSEVLRTFMHARFAGVVKGAGDVDYKLTRDVDRKARMEALREMVALRNAREALGEVVEELR